ncbi:ectoine hydroxylase [Kitasatospora sp. GAS204A]|uniref:phytanoyl-CoA dioxygenase family protein n=1 Tax=unclassified Kitasatospora TaxID=2633591 RepID=UPI0024763EB0|nr:phytanoyl-CoA dioxygenase family protein [Kitasatospora sp. GAS204B]MDH6119336.1 ectoine hydroxylase [Kitasatospora sp. GAS204B]
MTKSATATLRPMTGEQRARFERDGYLVIRGALDEHEVARYADALDRLHAEERAAGRVGPGGSMHRLCAVAGLPQAVHLIDHPRTFPLVWSVLGWNVHVYHSHLDVHPPIRVPKPYRFEWHQDGGRQNRELETEPRPRLSVKVAFWLSDVSEPGRGNFKVVPGSHLANRIDGPPRRDVPWPEPVGAVEVTVAAGDAVFFDRRLWHTRTDNHSELTRKGIFFAYAHRWQHSRDENTELLATRAAAGFTPVQRQLLAAPLAGPGQSPGDHQWGHHPDTTPLHGYLASRGLLDPHYPPLQP